MASLLSVKITGTGTREEISKALTAISENIYGPNAEELYNLDNSEYIDCSFLLQIRDLEEGEAKFQHYD